MNYIFLVACAVLFIVPLIFVVNDVYEDGFFGRVALLGISFSSATFLLEMANGQDYDMLPQTVVLTASFALFILWHLARFHMRVLRKQKQHDAAKHKLHA